MRWWPFERGVEFLDGAEGFAEFLAKVGGGFVERLEDLFFAGGRTCCCARNLRSAQLMASRVTMYSLSRLEMEPAMMALALSSLGNFAGQILE